VATFPVPRSRSENGSRNWPPPTCSSANDEPLKCTSTVSPQRLWRARSCSLETKRWRGTSPASTLSWVTPRRRKVAAISVTSFSVPARSDKGAR
jgi:hypothetical protein